MHRLVRLAPLVAVAACADDPYPPLSSDAHFVQVGMYSTPEECIANAPDVMSCLVSLSLCKDGRAGQRIGDMVIEGNYYILNSVAEVSLQDGSRLRFDVENATDFANPMSSWIIDTDHRWETEQFSNISCD